MSAPSYVMYAEHGFKRTRAEYRTIADARSNAATHVHYCEAPGCCTSIFYVDMCGEEWRVFRCDKCGAESHECQIAEDGNTALCLRCLRGAK